MQMQNRWKHHTESSQSEVIRLVALCFMMYRSIRRTTFLGFVQDTCKRRCSISQDNKGSIAALFGGVVVTTIAPHGDAVVGIQPFISPGGDKLLSLTFEEIPQVR